MVGAMALCVTAHGLQLARQKSGLKTIHHWFEEWDACCDDSDIEVNFGHQNSPELSIRPVWRVECSRDIYEAQNDQRSCTEAELAVRRILHRTIVRLQQPSCKCTDYRQFGEKAEMYVV